MFMSLSEIIIIFLQRRELNVWDNIYSRFEFEEKLQREMQSRLAAARFHKIPFSLTRNQSSPWPGRRIHQKRNNPTVISADDVFCAGLDGTPWPEENAGLVCGDDDNKEYFKHRKPSPLSQVEVADTRKPIARATDNYYGGDVGVILWRPEQLDSAEDSLRRAVEIWKQNAMRGDPDSPHGRVLRELRGENW